MSVTVFAPDDLEMIKGSPGVRRSYIDGVVVGLHPRNEQVQAQVDKVLKQRNALLKGVHGRLDSDAAFTLDVWDSKLAAVGDQLGALRAGALQRLSPLVTSALQAVAGGASEVTIRYQAPWFGQHEFAGEGPGLGEALAHARKDDVRRGVTTVGPHRDEERFDWVPMGSSRWCLMSWRDNPYRRFRDGPQPMGRGIDRVMKHLSAPTTDVIESVFSNWESLVGDVIATHTTPVKIDNGVLTLEVDDPAWASEMQWMSAALIEQIAEKLETDQVQSIRVQIARP